LLALVMAGSSNALASARWIFPPDYPAALLSRRSGGTVEFQLSFDPEGRVTGCVIQKSSGTALLDAQACRLSLRRMRAKQGEARTQRFQHHWKVPPADQR